MGEMPTYAADCLERAVEALKSSAGSLHRRLRDICGAVRPLMLTNAMFRARAMQKLGADRPDHSPIGADRADRRGILASVTPAHATIALEISERPARFSGMVEDDVPAEGFYPLDRAYRQPNRRLPGTPPVLSSGWAAGPGDSNA